MKTLKREQLGKYTRASESYKGIQQTLQHRGSFSVTLSGFTSANLRQRARVAFSVRVEKATTGGGYYVAWQVVVNAHDTGPGPVRWHPDAKSAAEDVALLISAWIPSIVRSVNFNGQVHKGVRRVLSKVNR